MVSSINVPIEIAGIVFLIFVFMCWLILKFITRMILLWRYKPENDKSRRPDERTNPSTSTTDKHFSEQGTTPSYSVGEDRHSVRKTWRNPFIRRK